MSIAQWIAICLYQPFNQNDLNDTSKFIRRSNKHYGKRIQEECIDAIVELLFNNRILDIVNRQQ